MFQEDKYNFSENIDSPHFSNDDNSNPQEKEHTGQNYLSFQTSHHPTPIYLSPRIRSRHKPLDFSL